MIVRARKKKWYFVTKIVLTYCEKNSGDRGKLLKFQSEGQVFAKCLRSLEQFNQTMNGSTYYYVLKQNLPL